MNLFYRIAILTIYTCYIFVSRILCSGLYQLAIIKRVHEKLLPMLTISSWKFKKNYTLYSIIYCVYLCWHAMKPFFKRKLRDG